MPYCPKCKKRTQVFVPMNVSGMLNKEDDVDCYPELEMDCADLDAKARCGACEPPDYVKCDFEAPLSEFKIPEEHLTDRERRCR